MRFFKYIWRKWQIALVGAVFGFGADEESKDQNLEHTINSIITPFGLVTVLAFFASILLEIIIRLSAALILKQKLNFDGSMTVDFIEKESIRDWMDKKGTRDISPTFEEEYLFYKYYKAVCKWSYKNSFRDHIPYNLDKAADNAKKNYLSCKLSGIIEELN